MESKGKDQVAVVTVTPMEGACWDGFLRINGGGDEEDLGLCQDSAAGSGGSKYLKVYIGGVLYTIEMKTA